MSITKPRTQRKKLHQAPAHLRHKIFSAPLSPDLKRKHGANSVPVKTGDSVRIMRGDRKGFEGKITSVDRGNYRIFIEGVTREKVDGSTIQIPIHPSKVMLTNLDLDDKWRRETMKRRIASPQRPVAVPAVETASEEKEAKEPPRRRRVDRKKGKERKKKTETEKPAPPKSKKPKKTPKPKRRQRKPKKAKAKEGAE